MKSTAILTGPATHLDHLGVLSCQLKIPLIVTEEKTFQLAKQFYPEVDVYLKGFEELTIEYLAQNFDLIFETGKFFAAELDPFFKLLFKKNMRFAFCPHGNSDKGHSLQNHVDQDISLVYGDHLFDLLKKTGAAEKIKHIVHTGNYRYPYYLKHKVFYDDLAERMVFQKFRAKKPVVLYAPTWQDKENPTSFFSATDDLIEQLTPSFNLLIKLHPFLFENNPAHVIHMMARYEEHPGVQFLNDFPTIYPLLARCDLYLGDYSSIGYDFLAFDKPLYFLKPQDSSSLLHSCGIKLPDTKDIGKILSETVEMSKKEFSSERQKTYSYAFGGELLPEDIMKNIINALNMVNY